MKSVIVIPIEPGKKESNRRDGQRRAAVPRRLGSKRRSTPTAPAVQGTVADRRMPGDRRRLPERRLGLKIDLDSLNLE